MLCSGTEVSRWCDVPWAVGTIRLLDILKTLLFTQWKWAPEKRRGAFMGEYMSDAQQMLRQSYMRKSLLVDP